MLIKSSLHITIQQSSYSTILVILNLSRMLSNHFISIIHGGGGGGELEVNTGQVMGFEG